MKKSIKETAQTYDIKLGLILRKERVSLGMSQSQVATMLGITFQQVQKYEKGTNRISMSTFAKMAEIYGAHIYKLAQNVNDVVDELKSPRGSITAFDYFQKLEVSQQVAMTAMLREMVK